MAKQRGCLMTLITTIFDLIMLILFGPIWLVLWVLRALRKFVRN